MCMLPTRGSPFGPGGYGNLRRRRERRPRKKSEETAIKKRDTSTICEDWRRESMDGLCVGVCGCFQPVLCVIHKTLLLATF
ncbi:hypothetical protein OIU76_024352 [Salix suchowensis]|uniref:Uncharacterized protein n=1 Tax=Salix koriyanagi TaxID=2511006 RepID=A0A9Q0UMY9_9ROSI|nr:hypothetical protein OIU76_024352 [Salix suchowensis]KAJ6732805.1 hypothetical protein OIU74_004703 [Salix koriyanagi]